jgi:hypothetical protein
MKLPLIPILVLLAITSFWQSPFSHRARSVPLRRNEPWTSSDGLRN